MCKLTNRTILYPTLIQSMVPRMECVYTGNVNCSLVPGKITKCPSSCNLDEENNKCVGVRDDMLCTSHFRCPSNYYTDGHNHCNINPKEEPMCEPGYEIVYLEKNGVFPVCVASWEV
jgi:hypothetical protein